VAEHVRLEARGEGLGCRLERERAELEEERRLWVVVVVVVEGE
jgi:hypothetical protein